MLMVILSQVQGVNQDRKVVSIESLNYPDW